MGKYLILLLITTPLSLQAAEIDRRDLSASVTLSPVLQITVNREGIAATGEVTRLQEISPSRFLIDFGQAVPSIPHVNNGRIYVDRERGVFYLIADLTINLFGAQVNSLRLNATATPKGLDGYDELKFSKQNTNVPDSNLARGASTLIMSRSAGSYENIKLSLAFGVQFKNENKQLSDSISLILE